MAKEQSWKTRTPLSDKFVVQQLFIGTWDDCTTATTIAAGFDKAKEARLHNHRQTRLIQRVETLIDEPKPKVEDDNDGY